MPDLRSTVLFLSLTLATALPAQPVIDAYISTGDNHWLGSSLPIDSPQSIADTMDFLQKVNGVQRVYWRGLEEATWVQSMLERPENPRYYSFWQWIRRLYRDVDPDKLAVEAAHARGMQIWGVGTMFDWGAQADTPGFGDYPANAESKLRLAHPEWVPIDRQGFRRQGGPIELAYPEARAALVKLHVDEVLRAGYDGMTFLTYVENYSMRFQDEFGYSPPIVAEFKRRYKIDITKESFTRYASKEDWHRLRGEYVTAYLRELKAELAKYGKQLGVFISAHDIRRPQPWNVPELMRTAGAMHFDLETWARDGIVDLFMVNGNSSPQVQDAAIRDTQWLTRQTKTEVTFLTSSPHGEKWKPLQASGVRTIIALNEDAHFAGRSALPEQTIEALTSGDLAKTCKALAQIIEGKLKATVEQLVPLAKTGNLVQRRLALQALTVTKDPAAVPAIEAALTDPETGIHCMAGQGLRTLSGPDSAKALLAAVEKFGTHPLRETATATLMRMQPVPREILQDAVMNSKSTDVRIAATKALGANATAADLPALEKGLANPDLYPRFLAVEAMGNVRKSPEATQLLINNLNNFYPVLANRAATSLGNLATSKGLAWPVATPPANASTPPAAAAPKPAPAASANLPANKALAALSKAFSRFTSSYDAIDRDWGFRSVGNAMLAFGPEGEAALAVHMKSTDAVLARRAFEVLHLRQRPTSFSEVSEAENDAAFKLLPAAAVSPTAAPSTERAPLIVDTVHGPYKTIAAAIKAARAGDTVKLTPAIYKESIVLHDKGGELARPIIIDGQGSTLDGSDDLDLAQWEFLSNNVYKKVHLMRMDDAILGRWFFLLDGKMQRMGRCSKGPSAPLKKPADLGDNEWTFVKEEDAFYLRVKPGTKVAAPMRSSGVAMSGNNKHLIIRNIISTHVYNDGFNIHGWSRDVRFENIKAFECGDDGVSAHGECEYESDGLEIARCATGITDTVFASTHYRNVTIRECDGFDLYFLTCNAHSITDAVIHSRAANALVIDGGRYNGGLCRVKLERVKIIREGPLDEIRIQPNSLLELRHFEANNLNLMAVGGELRVYDSRLSGDEFLFWPGVKWSGDRNTYQVKSWRYDKTSYSPATFDEWRKKMKADLASTWQ